MRFNYGRLVHSDNEGKAFANEKLLRRPGPDVVKDVTNLTFNRNLKSQYLLRYVIFL